MELLSVRTRYVVIESVKTYVCFITSGSLRISRISCASFSSRGRKSSLSVFATMRGSTSTILDSNCTKGRVNHRDAVCALLK